MEAVTVRLLPYTVADGPHNMAADETLLAAAARGVASLRFYDWTEATLSLGYFQPERLRHEDEQLGRLSFVRRPSGGDTLVHHHELTYALALPAGPPWQTNLCRGSAWLCKMHTILAAALADLGVSVRLHQPSGEEPLPGPLCFRHFAAGDLQIGAAKVAGSAQRRQRGALMQHGALLLAASPHAPILPGVRELTGRSLTQKETGVAVLRQFAQRTGWKVADAEWDPEEKRQIEDLVSAKYLQDAWNRKR